MLVLLVLLVQIDRHVDDAFPGFVACEVLREWRADDGRALAQVSTERPWGVESTRGETSFVVLAAQLRQPGEQAASLGMAFFIQSGGC